MVRQPDFMLVFIIPKRKQSKIKKTIIGTSSGSKEGTSGGTSGGTSTGCKTAKGEECKESYTYKDQTYTGCTMVDASKKWCYLVAGGWGYCAAPCN